MADTELSDPVIAGIMGWRGPGAYTAATLRKIREVIAADREARRASPAAAVPDDALPKVPRTYQQTEQERAAIEAYGRECARAAVEADRAQQGEPVDEKAEFEAWAQPEHTEFKGSSDGQGGWYYFDTDTQMAWEAWQGRSKLATKAPAPAKLTRSEIQDLAFGYCPSGKIGELEAFADALLAAAADKAPAPDTGIPNAGEVDGKPWADVLDRAAWMLDIYEKHLYATKPPIEEHPYIPSIEEAAHELREIISQLNSGRAPVSSTPTAGAVEAWNAAIEAVAKLMDPYGEEETLGGINAAMIRELKRAAPQPPEAKAGEDA